MITKTSTLCCKNPWYMIFSSHSNYVARRPKQQQHSLTFTLLCAKPPRYISKIHLRQHFSFFSANLTYIASNVTFSHLYYHIIIKQREFFSSWSWSISQVYLFNWQEKFRSRWKIWTPKGLFCNAIAHGKWLSIFTPKTISLERKSICIEGILHS